MMNPTSAQAITPPAGPQRAPASAGPVWTRIPQQHLPVWDERARKMGFPPSSR